MKRRILLSVCIAILGCSLASAASFVFPKPQGYVSDYAELLDSQTRLKIEQMGRSLEQKTGVELAVVIVKSTLPYDHLEYATRLFANWHVGKAGQDNGVLLLLAVNERKIKIETGYGIEDVITDGKAGELLDTLVLPKLQDGNYSEAIYNGALGIAQTIAAKYNVTVDGDYFPVEKADDTSASAVQAFFVLMFIVFMLNSRFGWIPFLMGGSSYGGFGSFGGGFGSFGGGSGGSGFGGFGGGMSGGGGASRGF